MNHKFLVPIKKPQPNFINFVDTLTGKIIPKKPPLVELLIDNEIMKIVLEQMLDRKWLNISKKKDYMGGQMEFASENKDEIYTHLNNIIEFWYHMGYDYVRIGISLPLPTISHIISETPFNNKSSYNRAWQLMTDGVIKNWEDFEKYPWPNISDEDFFIHEYISTHLPEGMGFISGHAGGVYEHTSRLLGYENLCYLLHDDPDLVKAVVNRIGEIIHLYNQNLLKFENMFAIFMGDDFGFNSQTLISPKEIRSYFLPWHKKYSQMIHEKDRLYLLHSCGKIDEIMNDLIYDVKIDGKHSFQDNLQSIIEAKKKYGKNISLLGGVDVDKMARLDSMSLRKYVRTIIEECNHGGKFAIGSGNSVTNYISIENYLTMIDEALR